jgi:hypothetical protein
VSSYDDDDRDDWFAEPDAETEPVRQPQIPEPEDDWFRDEASRPRVPRHPSLGTVSRRRIAAAAGAVVVLLLILWAAGAFGGGGSPKETLPPPTTSSVPTTTTPTTTPTTPAATPAPTTTLKPGDTGAQVKRLQRALAVLGYSPGKVDGSYGPATKKALTRFQQANKLTADGIFGPKTLKKLKQKLAAR